MEGLRGKIGGCLMNLSLGLVFVYPFLLFSSIAMIFVPSLSV
jgi:hypothetical protein